MPGLEFQASPRHLTRLIGQDAARDLLIDMKVTEAKEALTCGLATDLAETDAWPALVEAYAGPTLFRPRPCGRC